MINGPITASHGGSDQKWCCQGVAHSTGVRWGFMARNYIAVWDLAIGRLIVVNVVRSCQVFYVGICRCKYRGVGNDLR
jgi:hypothetical protein